MAVFICIICVGRTLANMCSSSGFASCSSSRIKTGTRRIISVVELACVIRLNDALTKIVRPEA